MWDRAEGKPGWYSERHAGNHRSLTICVNETHSCQSWMGWGYSTAGWKGTKRIQNKSTSSTNSLIIWSISSETLLVVESDFCQQLMVTGDISCYKITTWKIMRKTLKLCDLRLFLKCFRFRSNLINLCVEWYGLVELKSKEIYSESSLNLASALIM